MSHVRVLSATQVDAFRGCSLKWHYRYVEKVPEESKSGALVVGSTVDVAVKGVIHHLRSGETVASLKATDLARAAWDAELASAGDRPLLWGEKGQEAAWKAAVGLVEAYVALPDLAARIGRVEILDFRFELPVQDPASDQPVPGLFVQGFLDVIERTADGRLRAMDIKTASSRAGYAPEDLVAHLQGSLYAWALRELHGDRASPDVGFTVGLKLKEPVWIDRNIVLGEAAQRRAILTLLHARRGMDLGVAFPQPSFLCGSCSFFARCATWEVSPIATLRRDPFLPAA